ncbi:hypothetical protein [Desulfitobacterium sp. PCE1]|uniref:hypothetical protein n=1 Tax=Desulfitobacterium sp. PCE1 TaxID=146907 RepID=UPI00037AF8D9|nr:hypothetical protein [Desulfitobacterium sp. PCE1]
MKKILAIALTTLMLTGIVGCTQNTDSPETNISQENTDPAKETEDPQDPETDPVTDPNTPVTNDNNTSGDNTAPQESKPSTNTPPPKNTAPSKPQETVTPPKTPPAPTSPPESSKPSEGNTAATLEDKMTKLLTGVKIDVLTGDTEVTADRFAWYFGIDPIEGAEGLASEAMISSVAHSIALLQLPEGVDPAKTAAAIEQKIDPRKWICVQAEKTVVKHKGNLILVIMSHKDIADGVAANFDAL